VIGTYALQPGFLCFRRTYRQDYETLFHVVILSKHHHHQGLEAAMGVWKSNKQVLVGFSPRIQSYDIVTGEIKYMRWQHTLLEYAIPSFIL
jgi:hypothetical protein